MQLIKNEEVLDVLAPKPWSELLQTYSYNHNKRHLCLFMKQNYHFDRGLAKYKHATLPLSFSGITLWLFLKSNAGKNKQFLILISRHPRECGAVRKVEKN